MPDKIRISFAFSVSLYAFQYFSEVPAEFEICPEKQKMRGEYNITSVYTGGVFELTIQKQKKDE